MRIPVKAAHELLAFYIEAGADVLIGEEPLNRLADEIAARNGDTVSSPFEPEAAPRRREEGEASSHRQAKGSPSPAVLRRASDNVSAQPAPPPPDVAVMAAREAARSAQTLDELRALLDSFQGCALRATATQLVFADGNPHARLMFVGEAPGYEEDLSGRSFVGRSGKLLDRMIEAIGLDRSQAYIANVVPWRPPGNRTPTPQETAICLPFIRRQIELANPDILVCLGQPATQTLLGTREGITRTRGRWFKYDTGSREIRAMATLHPAYLLRQPLQKRLALRDFLAVKKALREQTTAG
jgi:uracil-DNA glycosylase family 4